MSGDDWWLLSIGVALLAGLFGLAISAAIVWGDDDDDDDHWFDGL